MRISREIFLYDEGAVVVVDCWKAEHPIPCSLAFTLDPRLTARVDRGAVRFHDSVGGLYDMTLHRLHPGSTLAMGASLRCEQGNHHCTESGSRLELVRASGVTSVAEPVEVLAPRVTKGPYSSGYGVLGETDYLLCDLGTARAGCVVTTLSRVGNVSIAKDSASNTVLFTLETRRCESVDRGAVGQAAAGTR